MRPKQLVFNLASAGLVMIAAHPTIAQTACERKTLEESPQWISSLEYNPTTSEIWVADPKRKELLAFSTKSGDATTVNVGDIRAASITKVEGGYLVMYRDDAAILAADKKPVGKLNVRQTKTGETTGLGSLYSNWITRGSRFLGYGSVSGVNLASQEYNPSRGFQLGFVTGRVSAGLGQFRDIELLEATEENELYLLGFPYFAENKKGLFYIRMVGDRAAIYQVKQVRGISRAEQLSAFPEDFRTIPRFKTPDQGPLSTEPLFGEIEKSKMVVGLFGQDSMLYVLAREQNPEDGTTQWRLFQIDPDKPKPLGEVRLPTKAAHLTLVPGPDYWYIFERGKVRGWGDQDIKHLLRVPKAWITSSSNSPLSSNIVVSCEEWK